MSLTTPPVIIIGAPRSGTNMLRDVLCTLPEFHTWPCDEINYIWRHGNLRYPSDEFDGTLATEPVSRFIRKQFDKLARREADATVVEKTCANSLRVEFIDRIFPEARYLFIVRDPYDVVASARKRWRAKLDLPYVLAKARYVPPIDAPYYALRYAMNRAHRILSKQQRLASWGPRLNGMEQLLEEHTLEQICAIQRRACVNAAVDCFEDIDPARVCRLRYEEFVTEPSRELTRLCGFLGVSPQASQVADAVKSVSTGSVGKGRAQLGDEVVAAIAPFVDDRA